MKMFETNELEERVILVGIDHERNQMPAESCLDELGQLAESSGAVVVGRLIQKRDQVHPGHYVGKGKLDEIKDLVSLHNATGIICDDELSSAQLRKMEQALDTKIMDRTMVILDIFAKNANSAEGKVQVELAQQNYRLSHLSGIGIALSRLGGGIGTRGPGEKKLETDRRHIRSRIDELNGELRDIQTQRQVLRGKRERNNACIVSMVGYTNAGKSTLMNALTGAGVLAQDQLFATLDTTTRKMELPGGAEVLFTDTVGFIQKLPHQLVKAFRATLEELTFADIIIHVVDASSPNRAEQMAVVYKTMEDLKITEKPIITVFNKMDLEIVRPFPEDRNASEIVKLSAVKGEGTAQLLEAIEKQANQFKKEMCILIPYNEGNILNIVYGNADIREESHREDGTYMELWVDYQLQMRLQPYSTEKAVHK